MPPRRRANARAPRAPRASSQSSASSASSLSSQSFVSDSDTDSSYASSLSSVRGGGAVAGGGVGDGMARLSGGARRRTTTRRRNASRSPSRRSATQRPVSPPRFNSDGFTWPGAQTSAGSLVVGRASAVAGGAANDLRMVHDQMTRLILQINQLYEKPSDLSSAQDLANEVITTIRKVS